MSTRIGSLFLLANKNRLINIRDIHEITKNADGTFNVVRSFIQDGYIKKTLAKFETLEEVEISDAKCILDIMKKIN